MSDIETSVCPVCKCPFETTGPFSTCPACMMELGISANPLKPSIKIPEIDIVQIAFPQLEIIELIGRGGMSAVYKARQPNLDRFVALKIMLLGLASRPTLAERFAREGKLLAKLNHPNIVSVHDFGHAETFDTDGDLVDFFYLILEYVDGVNLREAMKEERFTPEQSLAIIPKICEALYYAHEEGVLHRDIKPENILIDTKGRIKIADFGIGKLIHSSEEPESQDSFPENQSGEHLTISGGVLGTLNYMAPEQYSAPDTVDHRADIYSLGVIFYEMLTGDLPVGRFAAPSEKTTVGSAIDGIVMKALKANREQRHQSARELITAIDEIKPPDASKRHSRQTKLLSVFSLAFLLVAVALYFAGPYFERAYHFSSIQAETEFRLAQNEWEVLDTNVQYDRNMLRRAKLMMNERPEESGSIEHTMRLRALTSITKINEEWLGRRKQEMDAAEHKLELIRGDRNPMYRGLYYFTLWLPSTLTALSFAAGFICLKRLRNDREKPGIIPAGIAVVLSSQLFFIFAISLSGRFTN